jgi:hypothetical protein
MSRLLPGLLLAALLAPALAAADQGERETTRFNEAVTRLMQARDEALATHKAKAVLTLAALAKSRLKAEDAAGAGEAWRAVLMVDREHADARAYFTTLGTLDAVMAELDAKPTDLLGLDAGSTAGGKNDKKAP